MFAKVFTQIFDSSIADNYEIRHVFEDLLKLADSDGVVDMTIASIARRTNAPLDLVKDSIEKLQLPDPLSRTPGHEGRRIIPIDSHRDWGWLIINYKHYRQLRDEEARRSYNRDKKREERKEKKRQKVSNAVKQSQHNESSSSSIAATNLPVPSELISESFNEAWSRWVPYRMELKKAPVKTFEGQLRKLAKVGSVIAVKMIDQSIENGWQGLFELKENHENSKTNGARSANGFSRNTGNSNEGKEDQYRL